MMRHSRTALLAALLVGATSSVRAQTATGSISGTVMDSVHRRPLADATIIATPGRVERDTVFHIARSDGHGRFVLAGLREGRYELAVEHPYIDSSGVGAPPVSVLIRASDSVTVSLAIPSAATLRRALCTAAARDTTLGIVLGTVRRQDRSLAPGVTVTFTWNDFDVDRRKTTITSRQLWAQVVTDSLGVYRACGLPVAQTLYVQAHGDGVQQTGVIEQEITDVGVLVRDLTLAAQLFSRAEVAEASSPARVAAGDSVPHGSIMTAPRDSGLARGRYVVTGRVASAMSQPVASAQVRLVGTTYGTSSNEEGEFRLIVSPGGTQSIEVLALGYLPVRVRVDVGDVTPRVEVRLEQTAVVLDSIRVLARRSSGVNPPYREFDDRTVRSQGRFITEAQIERQHPTSTVDLFRTLPGLTVSVPRLGIDRVVLSQRAVAFTTDRCVMQLFVDGMEVAPASINTIPPSDIHGIEVFGAAEAPKKYNVGTCGMVLIWTR